MLKGNPDETRSPLLSDLWRSFRQLPLWVQLWMCLILMPVNMLSLVFIDQPQGLWVAFLANIAMLLNLPILLTERAFSHTMALPHVLPWMALVLWLVVAKPEGSQAYGVYLTVLLVVNGISLAFDIPDSVRWWRSRRSRRSRRAGD